MPVIPALAWARLDGADAQMAPMATADEMRLGSQLTASRMRALRNIPEVAYSSAAGHGDQSREELEKPSADAHTGAKCCAAGAAAPGPRRARAGRNSGNAGQALQPRPPVAIARQAELESFRRLLQDSDSNHIDARAQVTVCCAYPGDHSPVAGAFKLVEA